MVVIIINELLAGSKTHTKAYADSKFVSSRTFFRGLLLQLAVLHHWDITIYTRWYSSQFASVMILPEDQIDLLLRQKAISALRSWATKDDR